jgi:meso-butanediol dehydrogenase/(S,S)-butanediol dehydrogenase/diacetyl reductase
MNTNPISHRVALVTGAARGIGLAVARWFLDHDHAVVLIDRDAPVLAQARAALDAATSTSPGQAFAGRVHAVHADVSQPGDVERAVRDADARFGRIDALVNNAGVAIFKPILETTFAEFREVLATNLDGAFLCTQAAAPVMLRGIERGMQQGGAVVNIASISGLRASTLRVAYGTSKGALIQLTKQQAVELGNRGIRCNAVAPGPVDTDMAKLVHTVAIRADYHDVIPLNRYGTTDEIAAVVGFLCSDAAAYVNGHVIAADGGFEAAGVGLPTLRKSGG